jgi:hypothetical protein
MRDWFRASALYNPLWIVAGTIMGLWGTGMSTWVGVLWVAIGCVIAIVAWRASAQQVREGRLISENLGKLVSVTEPSPVNILAAAAAKILTLESEINALKRQQQRNLSQDQIETMSAYFDSVPFEEKSAIWVFFRRNNPEATLYAKQLGRFLSDQRLGGGWSEDSKIEPDLAGVVVRVKDNQSPPAIAWHLSEALKRANIESRIEVMPDLQYGFPPLTECQLIIGKNG